MARCPHCRKDAPSRRENQWFPFCSERCKALDLAHWFGGSYRVPAEEATPDQVPASPPPEEEPEPAPRRRPARRRLN